jgi:hypothetical protein
MGLDIKAPFHVKIMYIFIMAVGIFIKIIYDGLKSIIQRRKFE